MKLHPLVTALLAAAGLLAAGSAASQAYPNRPIKLIVPWTPAGTVDIAARQLAERMAVRRGDRAGRFHRSGAVIARRLHAACDVGDGAHLLAESVEEVSV